MLFKWRELAFLVPEKEIQEFSTDDITESKELPLSFYSDFML